MKKKQQNSKKDDGTVHLNERISKEVLAKLKETSKSLKEEEQRIQEEARERERQRRQEKEKNKSFEELLNESNLDWKSYK